MDEKFNEQLKNFVRENIDDKMIEGEFKNLGNFFSALGIKKKPVYVQQYNDHLIDAIVTSLLLHYDNVKLPDINSDEFKRDVIKQIHKSIQVAKETFAYMVTKFKE